LGGNLVGKTTKYCTGPNPAAGQNCAHFFILTVVVVVGEQARGHSVLRAQNSVHAMAARQPMRTLQLRAGST